MNILMTTITRTTLDLTTKKNKSYLKKYLQWLLRLTSTGLTISF